MWELEKLAQQADNASSRISKNPKKTKCRRASCCTTVPPSSERFQTRTWQARKRLRVEGLLSRQLTAIKSIRLKDGTLEFLCVW